MHGWLGVVEGFAALVVAMALILAFLAARRRWLNRPGGTFECSLRINARTPGVGWALGVGRYREEKLEWFRFFSWSLLPRQVFQRNEVKVSEIRDPASAEAVALEGGSRIIRLESARGDRGFSDGELAMSSESLTGLLSWLEASPPGVSRSN